jgi:hypothetical protein
LVRFDIDSPRAGIVAGRTVQPFSVADPPHVFPISIIYREDCHEIAQQRIVSHP